MAKAGDRIDAVLVCGGKYHDFDFARQQLLTELGRFDRLRTRVFEDYRCTDTDGALDGADVLVTYTCDVRPSAPQQDALERFVRRGGRWVALHGTNAALDAPPTFDGRAPFRTPRVFPAMADVLGSQFLAHPPVAPYRVEVTDSGHPLVADIEPFWVDDELYCSALYGPLEVLLHTRFTGECPGFAESAWPDDDIRPVLYLKRTGAGEVCYLTLGHCRGRLDMQPLVAEYPRVERGSWDVPEFRVLLQRCLEWALEVEHAAV